MRKVTVFTIFAAVMFAVAVSAQVQSMKPPQMPPRDPNQAPQQMPKGTASISGTVASANGGRPMRRAQVRIQSASSPMSRTTTTDDKGNFEIKDLPAGEFTVRASKPGYLEAVYGQKNPGSGRPGTPVSLKEAQHLEKLNLSIPKGAVITGTIVDDVGEPAFGVPVRALRWTWRNGEKTLVAAGNATTDDRGIYRIPTLSPGDYIVMATPRADSVNPEQMLSDKLAVEAMAAANAGGGMRFTAGSPFDSGPSGEDAPTSGYAPVFYPGTTMSNTATSVTIAPAEEKTGIDVQLQLVALGTITGTIVGDPKTILASSVQLSDANSGLPGIGARTASPDATGKFTFAGVAPGSYTLTAKSGNQTTIVSSDGGGQVMMFMNRQLTRGGGPGEQGPPAPPMWAKADAVVDGRSKTDVALVMQPGMTVAGSVKFDGTGEIPTDLTNIRLILGSAIAGGFMSGSATGTVNADGTFRLTDVMPGKYKISATPPRGWRAKTVDAIGKDALDFLLDVQPNEDLSNVTITFTNKPAELTGTLTDSSGVPTADYTIVLFAADQKFWTPTSRRILTTRPATDGKFSFRDLPPGDYRLVALEDAEPGSWFDPELLKQLVPASMSITMSEGLRKTQDLRVNK
jgi:hypothetical protein